MSDRLDEVMQEKNELEIKLDRCYKQRMNQGAKWHTVKQELMEKLATIEYNMKKIEFSVSGNCCECKSCVFIRNLIN